MSPLRSLVPNVRTLGDSFPRSLAAARRMRTALERRRAPVARRCQTATCRSSQLKGVAQEGWGDQPIQNTDSELCWHHEWGRWVGGCTLKSRGWPRLGSGHGEASGEATLVVVAVVAFRLVSTLGLPFTVIQTSFSPGNCWRNTSTCWPVWPSPMWSKGTQPSPRKRPSDRLEGRGTNLVTECKELSDMFALVSFERQYFSLDISIRSRFQSRISGFSKGSV